MTIEQRNAKIISHLKKNVLSYVDIGNLYGLSKQYIHQIAKENGLDNKLEKGREKLTQEYKEIKADLEEGLTTEEITKKRKISRTRFYYVVNAGAGKSILRDLKTKKLKRVPAPVSRKKTA